MSKKTKLLAVAACSAAMFALPAAASANPAVHISSAPTLFTASSNVAGFLTRSDNNNLECKALSSAGGEFTTTTTFKLFLTFHTCKSTALGVSCQSGATAGTITTTALEGHVITVTTPAEAGTAEGLPGVLITGNAGHVASFSCFGIAVSWKGEGIFGEFTAPKCGGKSKSAILRFASASAGEQKHSSFTGKTYDLTWTLGGSASTVSLDFQATITFATEQTLTCT